MESVSKKLRVVVRQQEPNCADCGLAVMRVVKMLERMSKPAFEISREDVVETAKKIGIPRERINWRAVGKYIESYNFEGPYSVWNGIEDGLKEGLNSGGDNQTQTLEELERVLREMGSACKIRNSDIQSIMATARASTATRFDEPRNMVSQILAEYSRNAPMAYEEDEGKTGAAIGALAASAAATGLENPELIPVVAPLGSAAGSTAEKELRKRIKF